MNVIETKDYWTILALEACGHVAEAIHPVEKDGRGTILVYYFSDEANEDYELWMRGAIGPKPKNDEEQCNLFEIVRRVQQSSTNFKNNLHRYCK